METIYTKRSSKRLPFYNKIHIFINSEDSISVNTLNISQDGICISSYRDIPVGTNILAHIIIGSETCEIEGKIEWSSINPNDNTFKMGVQLLEITNQFNEIYKQINRRFNNPKTTIKSEKDSFYFIHKV